MNQYLTARNKPHKRFFQTIPFPRNKHPDGRPRSEGPSDIINLPVQKILVAVLVLIVGCFIVLSIISSQNARTFRDTSFWIKNTQSILDKSKKISLLLSELQINSGAYIVRKDQSYINNYKKAKRNLTTELATLKLLSGHVDIQKRRLDTVGTRIHTLIKICDKPFESAGYSEQEFQKQQIYLPERRRIRKSIDKQIAALEANATALLKLKEAENSASLNLYSQVFLALLSSVTTLITLCLLTIGYYLKKKRVLELKLALSEERHNALLNNITEYAIYMTDRHGYILSWNVGAHNLKGYSENEIIGKNISIFYTQEDQNNELPEKELEFAARHGKLKTEAWRVRKDGSQFWAHLLITALYDSKGNLQGFSKVTRDDSLRKKAENETKRALAREKELNEMKSSFLSMASHEFKTPLSIIMASALVLNKLSSGDQQEEQRRNIRKIILSAKNLNAVIAEFLSVQQLEEGKIEMNFQSTDLPSFCKKLCRQLTDITKTGQTILYQHKGDTEVVSDYFMLQQIFTNLISNSIKYSPEGSVIHVETWVQEQAVQITVRDEGIGISEKDQIHLFERFYRGSNAIETSGTGLGLYIVNSLSRALGGSVSFKSQSGKGTEFVVELQRKDQIENKPSLEDQERSRL